jgi:hypothetical protein
LRQADDCILHFKGKFTFMSLTIFLFCFKFYLWHKTFNNILFKFAYLQNVTCIIHYIQNPPFPSFFVIYILLYFTPHQQSIGLFVYFGFYVTSTQYKSYRNIPALLVEEDFRCPSGHYFRHERAPEQNHRRSVS